MKKKGFTLKKRLSMYNRALKDYGCRSKATQNGFCYYFKTTYPTKKDYNRFYYYMSDLLPELFSTFIDKSADGFRADERYGATERRIECLKKAIKTTKAKIKRASK